MSRTASASDRSREEYRSWIQSGKPSPGCGAPSARVLASKGRKAKYQVRFVDTQDPDTRARIERISVGLAKIDARPHRDPAPWKITDYRALPSEAQRLAAAGRALAFLVPGVDPAEECAESADKGPHVPMADGRCSLCDRHLAMPDADPAPVADPIPEPEPEPAPVATRKARKPRAPRVKPSAVSVRAAIVVAEAMAERVERTGSTEPDRHEPPTPEPVVYTGPVLVPDLEPPPRPEWRCQTCTREGYGGPPQHCPGCTSERDDRHGPAPTSVPARPFRGAGAYSRRAS